MASVKEILNRDFLPELAFETSRSSGAGGQHVNKVETRVSLRWQVLQSQLLSEEEKEYLQKKWKSKLTQDGELLLHESGSRSQFRNKEKVIEKLKKELKKAFTVVKKRKYTQPPKSAIRKRLRSKKKHGEKKAMRKPPGFNYE